MIKIDKPKNSNEQAQYPAKMSHCMLILDFDQCNVSKQYRKFTEGLIFESIPHN